MSPAELGADLLAAAAAGSLEGVAQLLAEGAPVDWEDGGGYTPLLAACREGQLEAAQALLVAGASPSKAAPCQGCGASNVLTPLHLAARTASADLVRLLVAAGCDPAQGPGHNGTPLHHAACYAPGPATILALLEAGAAVSVLDTEGDTPLQWAAEGGTAANIEALVAAGQEPDVLGSRSRTPLHWAALRGKADAVRALLRLGARAHLRDYQGNTPVHLAAVRGHADVLEALCAAPDAAATLSAANSSGDAPLHLAVCAKVAAPSLEVLLRAGADPAGLDRQGRSALHLAVLYQDLEPLELLCRGWPGLELDAQAGVSGETPLSLAASQGDGRACLALLHAGAAPHVPNSRRWLPLILAAVKVPGADFRAMLAALGVLEGAGERLRAGVLTVALRHGKRGDWLAPLLPAGAVPGRVLRGWAVAAFPQPAEYAAAAARVAALACWGLPREVLARVAAYTCLVG